MKDPKEPTAPLAYSIPKFCAVVPIGRSTAYEEIKAGRLKIFKVGTRTFVSRWAARKWIRQREVEAERQRLEAQTEQDQARTG